MLYMCVSRCMDNVCCICVFSHCTLLHPASCCVINSTHRDKPDTKLEAVLQGGILLQRVTKINVRVSKKASYRFEITWITLSHPNFLIHVCMCVCVYIYMCVCVVCVCIMCVVYVCFTLHPASPRPLLCYTQYTCVLSRIRLGTYICTLPCTSGYIYVPTRSTFGEVDPFCPTTCLWKSNGEKVLL